MTDYSRGDVVLVRYGADGNRGPSLRPALVLSSETYRQGRHQVVLAAMTTNRRSLQPGDTAIWAWQKAGLLGPSLVTGVLLTATLEAI